MMTLRFLLSGRPVHLRTRLLVPVLVASIPLAIFAALVVFLLWRYQDAQVRAGRIQTAEAIAAAVRAEIDSTRFHARYIASSPLITPQHFNEFRARCADAIRSRSDWNNIVLIDRAGRQLINTLYEDASTRPNLGAVAHIRQAMETAEPTVSDLRFATDGRPLISVNVPIATGGQVAFVLVITLRLTWFDELLSKHMPSGAAGLVDGELRFISRSIEPDSYRGRHPVSRLTQRMAEVREGEMTTDTYEGVPVHSVWVEVPGSTWRVAIGYPDMLVGARLSWTVVMLVALGLLVLAVGLLAARRNSLKLERAIKIATDRSGNLADGKAISLPPTNTIELDRLGAALSGAAVRIGAAEAERDRLLMSETRARRFAENANRSKDEFLAVLGHELRNPIGAISNAVTLLGLKNGDAVTLDYATTVLTRQTAHLRRLIDDLLDVARVISGKVQLRFEVVDLCACTQAAIESLRAAGTTNGRSICLDCRAVNVHGDRMRIEQVIMNLLTNAVKYSPGDTRILVSVREDNGVAELAVSDAGAGLSAEERDRVFDLFYQGDGRENQGGLGVGLTLCKRIAELHRGTVDVSSPGRGMGATFTLRLPVVDGQQAVAKPADEILGVRKRTIAVVDDNEDGRISLAMLLRNDGHTVYEYSNGADCLRSIPATHPEIAILDIGMPVMNGYELAARLRQSGPRSLCLIALTGYGQIEDIENALAAGFDTHLVKPVDLDELRAAIERHCAVAQDHPSISAPLPGR